MTYFISFHHMSTLVVTKPHQGHLQDGRKLSQPGRLHNKHNQNTCTSLVVCTTNTIRIHAPVWLSAQQTQPEYIHQPGCLHNKHNQNTLSARLQQCTQKYRKQQKLLSSTDNKTYSAVQTTKPTQQYRQQNLLSHTDNKTYSSAQIY